MPNYRASDAARDRRSDAESVGRGELRRHDEDFGTPEIRPAPTWIDDDRTLEKFGRFLGKQRAFAIDTEGNSMYAYHERLCLVQISTRRKDYLIDPLAVDIAPLGPALADPGIMKVLHGAEFDVLMLKRTASIEVAGIFDTRVAAASLSEPQLGLAGLLESRRGVVLDKSHQRSDWGRRPLSEGQLDYARQDTCHLLDVADELRAELRAAGTPHVQECAAECRRLEALEPGPQEIDFLKVKGVGKLDGRGRRVLEHVNRLRHELAEERDQPLFKVFGNETLIELAQRRPRTMAQLGGIRKLPSKLRERYGRSILHAVSEAEDLDPLPAPKNDSGPEDSLRGRDADTYERLRKWRHETGCDRGVENALILSRQALVDLARLKPKPKTVEALAGSGVIESWRALYYGESLLRTLLGR